MDSLNTSKTAEPLYSGERHRTANEIGQAAGFAPRLSRRRTSVRPLSVKCLTAETWRKSVAIWPPTRNDRALHPPRSAGTRQTLSYGHRRHRFARAVYETGFFRASGRSGRFRMPSKLPQHLVMDLANRD